MNIIRLCARAFLRNPALTLFATLNFALGVGATTTVFAVINAVLLRPLAYEEPERLVQVWETNPDKGWDRVVASPANFLDWKEQSRAFESIGAYDEDQLTLTGNGDAEQIPAAYVSPSLLKVLRAPMVVGRPFLPEEDWSSAPPVAILGYGPWQRRFGANPGIVGRSIELDGKRYAVVGVLGPDFRLPASAPEVYLTHRWNPVAIRQSENERRGHYLQVVARLAPGISEAEARAELTTIAARLEREYPKTNAHMGAGLTPLRDWVVGDTRGSLLLLFGAVGLVLLIACGNVMNLLLARNAERTREVAIRSALGAGQPRLFGTLLVEALSFALLGGGLGILLSTWACRAIIALAPQEIPRLQDASLDFRVIAFGLGMVALSGIASGLLAAAGLFRQNLSVLIKQGGRTASQGTGSRRVKEALVVAEVGLALVLLVSAGLLIRSFVALQQVDPGVRTKGRLTLQLALAPASYKTPEAITAFYDELTTRLKALPGVEAVGAASVLPLAGEGWTSALAIAGRGPDDSGSNVQHKEVSPEYFRSLGLPLVRGRGFASSDDAKAIPVVLVNEAFARQYFAKSNPVGQRITFDRVPAANAKWHTIVGVVRNEKQDSLRAEVQPQVYQSFSQSPQVSRFLILRTAGDPLAQVGSVRRQVRDLDPRVPIFRIRTMSEVLSSSLSRERFLTLLLALFSGLAVALAAAGVFGTLSYFVGQRRQEIGIRMALGASESTILWLIVRQGMSLVVVGLAFGIVTAFAAVRSLRSLLFSISPLDPMTFVTVGLLTAVIGLVACLIPAWRATGVDPMVTLNASTSQ